MFKPGAKREGSMELGAKGYLLPLQGAQSVHQEFVRRHPIPGLHHANSGVQALSLPCLLTRDATAGPRYGEAMMTLIGEAP